MDERGGEKVEAKVVSYDELLDERARKKYGTYFDDMLEEFREIIHRGNYKKAYVDNPVRQKDMATAYGIMRKLFPEAEVKMGIDEAFCGYGGVSVRALDELILEKDNMRNFMFAISSADSFVIESHNDDTVEFVLTFKDVMTIRGERK